MSMTIQEAIKRIRDHMEVHNIGEPPHIHIGDALLMAIDALREKAEREDPQPLTLEELRQMDGEPVWVKTKNAYNGEGECCVVHVLRDRRHFVALIPGIEDMWHPSSHYGKEWLAYRHKPKEVAENAR